MIDNWIGWLVYDVISFCLFAPSVSVSVKTIASPASIVTSIASVSTTVPSTIVAGTSVVSIPGISSSLGLRVSLGVSLTLLAFSLFSRGNYGKSIAVKATIRETINTCVMSIGDSGHGVGDSWCANSVSVGNSVVSIGESIANMGCIGISGCVRVDYLRGSQGRAGGQDGGVSFGITLASVVSVSVRVSVVSTIVSATISVSAISVSMAIVSVPSISCGISLSLRSGLRLGKCQTGQ